MSEKEIEIKVSLTISKIMTITVSDYDIKMKNKSNYDSFIDNLKKELKSNTYLPHTIYKDLENVPITKTFLNDLKEWNEDRLDISIIK